MECTNATVAAAATALWEAENTCLRALISGVYRQGGGRAGNRENKHETREHQRQNVL